MTTATVVGAGPNGLSAAIRLAQAGVKVRVVEASDRVGGGVRTSELTLPGVRHDDCSTAMPGALASQFFRSLELEKHGVTWLHHHTAVAHPTRNGVGVITRDLEETARRMGPDGPLWLRLFRPLVRNAERVFDTAFTPPATMPRHPMTLARFGARAAPSAVWTSRFFRREENAAAFAGVAAHAITDLRAPMSSAVGIMLTTALHAHGWPIVQGGAENLTRALVHVLEGLGATVETGRRVQHTAELDTDLVLLTVPPPSALEMIDALPRGTARAWRKFRPGPGAFKLDLAVAGDVPWRDHALRDAGVIHLGGTMSQIAAAERDVVRGRMPQHPFMLVAQPHLVDPTRSANGVNPLWVYAHVPNGWPHDETEHLLQELERYAPGLRDRVLAVHTRGPRELAQHNAAYLGGDIGGGANTMRQMLARPRLGFNAYRAGVSGVYLAGASTSPAGGVHGMCGLNAAETALRDLTR